MRAQLVQAHKDISDLRSHLSASELRIRDYQDLLSSKEDHIISQKEKLIDVTTSLESHRANFQELLNSACSEHYMKGFNQAKAGGSSKVEEKDGLDEDGANEP